MAAARVVQGKKTEVDWNRFGLVTSQSDNDGREAQTRSYGTDGHQPTDANELFAGEQVQYFLDMIFV